MFEASSGDKCEVSLLQFFYVSAFVLSYVEFVLYYLFLISPSFGASGGLCFLIVTFPGYLHIYFLSPILADGQS